MGDAPPIPLPTRAQLREVLAALVGDVTVSDAMPRPPAPTDCIAVYGDDAEAVAAIAVIDLGLAAAAGAAVGLAPPRVADYARETRTIAGTVRDGLREIVHVLATLFGRDELRIRFAALHVVRADAPPACHALAERPGARLDVHVDLGPYGRGVLSLLTRR